VFLLFYFFSIKFGINMSIHLLTQEYGTSQTEGFAQPIGSSQPLQRQLGHSTACTSMSTRRGKTIVPTMEKAVVVMEVNKKKKEEAGLAKVLDPKKGTWIGQNSRIGLLACNITI
jgi:hypothetical protein